MWQKVSQGGGSWWIGDWWIGGLVIGGLVIGGLVIGYWWIGGLVIDYWWIGRLVDCLPAVAFLSAKALTTVGAKEGRI